MDFLSPANDHNNDLDIRDYPLSFKQAFLSVKPAILVNCTFKIIPSLFFVRAILSQWSALFQLVKLARSQLSGVSFQARHGTHLVV